MAHSSKIFNSIPIDMPNRSGFDMSFENLLTLPVGTLVPVLCEECIPNETYNIGHVSQVVLPPMATNFFGRVDLRFEAFFVPNRILWGAWQNFWTMPFNNPYGQPTTRPTSVPTINITSGDGTDGKLTFSTSFFKRGSLADFLGIKVNTTSNPSDLSVTALPFFAYHKIYDDWYRNSKIQKPVFVNYSSSAVPNAGKLPWISDTYSISTVSASNLADDESVLSLRQRNWAKDYFTTASLYPQASGDVIGSSVELDTSGANTQLSIGALRSANVLQRWMDRNNVAGERYADQIKAHYGVLPSDALLDRPIFLGSDVVGVYNRSVYTTSSGAPSGQVNPFAGNVGSTGASSQGFKDGGLVDNFKTTEHGYIMILASLVPHAYYSTGVRRQMLHKKQGDFAIPLLQGLGMQAISTVELSIDGAESQTFGYQQQYSEYKYHDDEVHGLLVDGESLQSFALQRGFDRSPLLGSAFLEIPQEFMDGVTAVESALSKYGGWLDCYISMRKVSPLAEYVIPTLGDLKNTHKENIPLNGRQL